MLHSEIGEIKKDFSQNLIDVKSSMVNQCGFPGDDDVTSTPDIEFMNNSGDDFMIPQVEEEKLSSISKYSYSILQNNQNLNNHITSGGNPNNYSRELNSEFSST